MKRYLKLQGAQYIVPHKSWILECHLKGKREKKRSTFKKKKTSTIYYNVQVLKKKIAEWQQLIKCSILIPTVPLTHLFQLLVGVPLPHILVFVVCIRIALPATRMTKWAQNKLQSLTRLSKQVSCWMHLQRSRSWVIIWTAVSDQWQTRGRKKNDS